MPRGYELKGEDERPKEERHTHTIMASNFLAGIAHFLEVQLPERWRLSTGRTLPEVNRTEQLPDALWVMDGNCTYVMYDEGALKAYELVIRVWEGRGKEWNKPGMAFMKKIFAGGHEAKVHRGEVLQGLFRRKSYPMLAVDFNCPRTSRNLRMELRGRLEGDDLDIFLESLEDLVCH